MSSGAALFHDMTNMYVPSQPEIDAAVTKIMSVTSGVATAIDKEIAKATATPPPSTYAGASAVGPGGAAAGADDPILKAAAARAQSMTSVMQFVTSGVQGLQAMRNLSLPSPEEIGVVVDRVFTTIDKAIADLPPHDPAVEAKVKAWGEAMGPLMGAVSSGVQAMQGMRNLSIPSDGEMKAVTEHIKTFQDSFAAAFSMDPETAAHVQQGAQAIGSVFGAVGAGVTALKDMRNLAIPGPAEMASLNSTLKGLKIDWSGVFSMEGTSADQLKQGADAYAAVYGALGAGVSTLKAMRDLAEPSVSMMTEFKAHMVTLNKEFVSSMSMDGDTADRITQGANALNAVYNALSAGATTLQKIRDLPIPSDTQIGRFKTAQDQLAAAFTPEAKATAQATADRMLDWGNGMGPMMQALATGADTLAKIPALYLPTHDEIDSFFDRVKYLGDKATATATTVGPDLALNLSLVAKAQQDEFAALAAGADVITKVAATPVLPKSMIDDYFKNLDEFTKAYASGMKDWVAHQDFEYQQYSKELGDELTALTAGTDFLSKLGTLRPDYTNAINGYFAELTRMVDYFAQRAETWSQEVTPQNAAIATRIKTEMDALNSAMDVLSKVQVASQTRPDMVFNALNNVGVALDTFKTMADNPRYSGSSLAEATKFAGNVQQIFGSIKTTIEAVNLLSQPGQATGALTFGAAMQSFFFEQVPAFGDSWVATMERMALGSENMAARTVNAMAGTPPGQAMGLKGGMPVPNVPSHIDVTHGGAGGGSGNTYTNCVVIDGNLVASDPDIAALVKKITDYQTIKNGGTPAGGGR